MTEGKKRLNLEFHKGLWKVWTNVKEVIPLSQIYGTCSQHGRNARAFAIMKHRDSAQVLRLVSGRAQQSLCLFILIPSLTLQAIYLVYMYT